MRVALPLPLHRLFDYAVEPGQVKHVSIGARVAVPFGKKILLGIVAGIQQKSEHDSTKVKKIIAFIDTQSIFSKSSLDLATWLSEFYLYPIGEVYAAMLPKLLRSYKNGQSGSTQMPAEYFVKPLPASKEQLLALKRSKQQWKLYHHLQETNSACALKKLKQIFSTSVIKSLVDKSLAQQYPSIPELGSWQKKIQLGEKKRANPEQAIAIACINQASGFSPFLIEGVTGSGKTEVYLQVIEDVILQGKQVLVMVPEIGLTPQTLNRFVQRFGEVVGVWHSGLSDHERLLLWQQVKHNQIGVVIGTRSSVFLPFLALGMMIVDEEHDESFKQQDSLRYHARDVAAYRAKQAQVSLILGSATPSLESLHNALSHKYRHLLLSQRAGAATMPAFRLLDIKGLPLQAGIAQSIIERIKQQLEQGNQVLVFVNRRGYAPAIICESCGHVEDCKACDTPFTYHQISQNLQCHRCGQYKHYSHTCSKCGAKNITTQGVGTEQIQAYLSSRFPEYSCVRIDSDSTRGKKKLYTLLDEINQNKHQILVGTQILSKGHHFPNVTLALIVNVDSFLFSSDFRAPEKLAQLIVQLSGRAGRANKPGEVWLQSLQVANPLLQDLVNNGYSHFSRTLLQERVKANLPPKQWQIALRVEHAEQELIFTFMQYANAMFAQFKALQFIGPFPAGIEKKQTRYRFITIVQSHSNTYLNQAIKQVQQALCEHKLASKVRWNIDVMPMDFS